MFNFTSAQKWIVVLVTGCCLLGSYGCGKSGGGSGGGGDADREGIADEIIYPFFANDLVFQIFLPGILSPIASVSNTRTFESRTGSFAFTTCSASGSATAQTTEGNNLGDAAFVVQHTFAACTDGGGDSMDGVITWRGVGAIGATRITGTGTLEAAAITINFRDDGEFVDNDCVLDGDWTYHVDHPTGAGEGHRIEVTITCGGDRYKCVDVSNGGGSDCTAE